MTLVKVRCSGPVMDQLDGRCPQQMSGELDLQHDRSGDALAAMVRGLGWQWTGRMLDDPQQEPEQLVYCPLHVLAGRLDSATELGTGPSYEAIAALIAETDEAQWQWAWRQGAATRPT